MPWDLVLKQQAYPLWKDNSGSHLGRRVVNSIQILGLRDVAKLSVLCMSC